SRVASARHSPRWGTGKETGSPAPDLKAGTGTALAFRLFPQKIPRYQWPPSWCVSAHRAVDNRDNPAPVGLPRAALYTGDRFGPYPMRYPPQFLDELRARLPVSEVVGRRVKLRKAGREWKGLSPFNKEKTPSFFVNDQKMAWFDFSSGKNGSIFDFVMLTEGLSFPEAVERLAAEAGMPLPKVSPEDEARLERRKTLH